MSVQDSESNTKLPFLINANSTRNTSLCSGSGKISIGVDFINMTSLVSCNCDIGFFGQFCGIKGIETWRDGWVFFQCLFSFLYLLIFLFTFSHFRKTLKKEHGNFFRLICRLIRSPKYLVITNLFTFSSTRIIYFALDPFSQRGLYREYSRIINGILLELIFSTSFSFLFILFLVWSGLYSAFDTKKDYNQENNKIDKFCEKRKYQINQLIVILVLVLIYPFQFIVSYLKGSFLLTNQQIYVIIGGLFTFIFVSIIIFSCITFRFKRNLLNSHKRSIKDMNNILKSNTKFKGKKPIILNPSYNPDLKVQEFFNELKSNHLLKFVVKQLYSGPDNVNYEASSQTTITDIGKIDDDSFQLKDDQLPNQIEEQTTIIQKDKINYRLSDDDVKVLGKIVMLTIYFIFILVLIIGLGIIIFITDILANATKTLISLYFFFSAEIFSIYFVSRIFINEIESSEYENLKIVGDIENFLKRNMNKLMFEDIQRTTIYKRFNFIKFWES